jgi:hypothetical protein
MNSGAISRARLDSALRKLRNIEMRVRLSLTEDDVAIRQFAASMVVDPENHEAAKAADAFIQRFEQLFETALRRLFPATLRVIDIGDRSEGLLEMVNRLERLEFIADAARWLAWKELRDRLIHEYPDEPVDRARDLTDALEAAQQILIELTGFRDRLTRSLDSVSNR